MAVTVVLFIYGEAIPKTVAIRRPRHLFQAVGSADRAVRWVLGPVVAVLVWIAEVQSPLSRDLDEHGGVSEDELLHLTGEAAAAYIEPSDAELIERSFDLGDLRAGEILVPLEQVVGTPTTTPVSEALSILIAAGHRRLVVSERSPERVVGFVGFATSPMPPPPSRSSRWENWCRRRSRWGRTT
ncbi:MAG: CNNM domain-containing protein [Microthrixaceae bacterium]